MGMLGGGIGTLTNGAAAGASAPAVVAGAVPNNGTAVAAGINICGDGTSLELACDVTSLDGGAAGTGLTVVGIAGTAAAAVTGGGGGIVPTTGDDIMGGGTIAITGGAASVVGLAPIVAGLAAACCGMGGSVGMSSMGIRCKYPYPIPQPILPSPPQALFGVIVT